MPFNADKKCDVTTTKYEEQLETRFNLIKKQDTLNLEVKYIKGSLIITKDKFDVIPIQKKYNPDMVIWGNYEENCENDMKVSINYHLSNKIAKGLNFSSKTTRIHPINSLESLRNGELQQDIDHIILWGLSMYYFKNKNYQKSLKLIKKTINNSINSKHLYNENTLAFFCSRGLKEFKKGKFYAKNALKYFYLGKINSKESLDSLIK